jgi:hypothetical protein
VYYLGLAITLLLAGNALKDLKTSALSAGILRCSNRQECYKKSGENISFVTLYLNKFLATQYDQ